MSFEASEFCKLIQQDLAEVAGQHYGLNKRQQVGFFDSLVSDTNRSLVQAVEADAKNGKNRTVILRYWKPGTMDETSSSPASVCDSGTENEPSTEIVSVTQFLRSPIMQFNKDEMRDFCEQPSQVRAATLMGNMNAFFRKLNRNLLSTMSTNFGKNMDGDTEKTINLLALNSGIESAVPQGEIEILEDFQNLGFPGTPIVVGAGHLSKYAKYQKLGCCNQWGQNIAGIGDLLYYRDLDVDQIIGNPSSSPVDANHIVAYAPGSIQLLTWLANKGEFADTANPHSAETTIVDPITGQELDFEFYYDRCDKVWKMFFSLNYELHFLPEMYKAADDRYETNMTLHYQAEYASGS